MPNLYIAGAHMIRMQESFDAPGLSDCLSVVAISFREQLQRI